MMTDRSKSPRAPRLREAAAPGAGSARWLRWLLPAVTLLLIATMSIHPKGVNDLWWQLKTGELIWTRHSVPRSDLFSYTAAGQPWHVQEWLAELLFFGLYRGISPDALAAFKLFACTLLFALVLWRCWLRCRMPALTAAVTVVAAYAAWPGFAMRPQLFSYLFLALALLFLDQWRRGAWRWAVWTLPLITMLWVNLHGGFLVMFALLGVEIGAEVWGLPSGAGSPRRLGQIVLVTALCGLAGLLNPGGMEAYRYALLLLGHHDMLNQVVEWASPDFHEALEKPLVYVILLLALAVAFARRSNPRDLLLMIGLLHSALFSKRHMPLLAVASAPIVAGLLGAAAWDARRWMEGRRWSYAGWRTAASVSLAGLLMVGVVVHTLQYQRLTDVPTAGTGTRERGWFAGSAAMALFPSSACDFLMSQPGGARLFNSYGWGGYCIWRLWPKYQVFIDGRAEVFFKTSYPDYRPIVTVEPDWEERLARWKVDTVLVDAGSLLAATLDQRRNWQQVYHDDLAVIYRRAPALADALHGSPVHHEGGAG
jgi:hypothetical protein